MAHKLTHDERLTRLWARIDRTSPDGCWIWTGGATGSRKKYGVVRWDGESQLVSRIVYALEYGAIQVGCVVVHTCKNPLCVNPVHLSTALSTEIARALPHRNEQNGRHKLTDAQIAEIRRRYDAGNVTQRALADEYSLHYSQVSLIVRGKRRPT